MATKTVLAQISFSRLETLPLSNRMPSKSQFRVARSLAVLGALTKKKSHVLPGVQAKSQEQGGPNFRKRPRIDRAGPLDDAAQHLVYVQNTQRLVRLLANMSQADEWKLCPRTRRLYGS